MEHSDTDEFQLSLDQMPVLIIEVLAQYLSNKDLVACCAVNRGWREAFDIEPVWKPRYDEHRVKYLLKTPCKVEPGFVHPETLTSCLSPMSEWRAAFVAENHLLNNWRQGKYVLEKISISEVCQSDIRRNNIPLYWLHNFINCDYVVAMFPDRIDVLDVRNYPATRGIESIPVKLHSYYNVVGVNNMMLIVISKGVVVYKLNFSTKKWRIKHAIIIDEPASFTCINKIKSLQCQKLFSAARCLIAEHFLIGFLKSDTTMHIWNFETGLKLKEEISPIENSTFVDIKSSNSNLIIVVKHNDNDSIFFLAYDLSKLIFYPFKEVSYGHYFEYCVCGDYVAIWLGWFLNIYHYKTGKKKLSNYRL